MKPIVSEQRTTRDHRGGETAYHLDAYEKKWGWVCVVREDLQNKGQAITDLGMPTKITQEIAVRLGEKGEHPTATWDRMSKIYYLEHSPGDDAQGKEHEYVRVLFEPTAMGPMVKTRDPVPQNEVARLIGRENVQHIKPLEHTRLPSLQQLGMRIDRGQDQGYGY